MPSGTGLQFNWTNPSYNGDVQSFVFLMDGQTLAYFNDNGSSTTFFVEAIGLSGDKQFQIAACRELNGQGAGTFSPIYPLRIDIPINPAINLDDTTPGFYQTTFSWTNVDYLQPILSFTLRWWTNLDPTINYNSANSVGGNATSILLTLADTGPVTIYGQIAACTGTAGANPIGFTDIISGSYA